MATTALTAADFETTISENDIVLVDFWASWCGPCRQFAPTYETASQTHPEIVFGKVDTEAEQSLAVAARISSIPTLMAFRQGILVFSQPGALPAPALDEVISAGRGLDMDEVRAEIAHHHSDQRRCPRWGRGAMSYALSTTLDEPYESAVEGTRAALADLGFGVLSEIDIRATLRAKLNIDAPAQVILGACRPPLAYAARPNPRSGSCCRATWSCEHLMSPPPKSRPSIRR